MSEIIKPEERKNITILFRNYLPARPKTEYKYLKENVKNYLILVLS